MSKKTSRINFDGEMLLCSRCGTDKPVTDFTGRQMPAGPSFYSYCKECGLALARESYSRKSAEIAERRKQRYATDPEYRQKQNMNSTTGYQANKAARLAQYKEYKMANLERDRERERWSHLRRQYGLSREEYEQMSASQFDRCAICDRERKLFVDHCHATGNVRGLLCNTCNAGLGLFGDSVKNLKKAAKYVAIHKTGECK